MPSLLRQLREQFSKLARRRDRAVMALEDGVDPDRRTEWKQQIAGLTTEMMSYHRALKLNYEPERGEFGGRLVEVDVRVESRGQVVKLDRSFDDNAVTGELVRTGTD